MEKSYYMGRGGGRDLMPTKSILTTPRLCLAPTWSGSRVKWETSDRPLPKEMANPRNLSLNLLLLPSFPGPLEPRGWGCVQDPSLPKAVIPNTFA